LRVFRLKYVIVRTQPYNFASFLANIAKRFDFFPDNQVKHTQFQTKMVKFFPFFDQNG